MLIKKSDGILSSEITPESIYKERRTLIKGLAALGVAVATPAWAASRYDIADGMPTYPGPEWLQSQINQGLVGDRFSLGDKLTPYINAISHNNFYEFGTDKRDPARNAQAFKTDPWKVSVEGYCNKPGDYYLEDLVSEAVLEERIYRLRCVEGWSMVIPWVGIPLATLLKRFEPSSKAKFVVFETLYDPEQMPAQKSRFGALPWPYVEGLRIDEAMNELSFMAVGVYGAGLPPQNGAPFRLVLPWKYGFKSIKSIVSIRFVEEMPNTSWNAAAPGEYGFYANVNPDVDHPRWSQATERRLPSSLFSPDIRDTELFNGYGEQVAHLYAGMNLRKWY
ncbi:MAG: protein-methionine-sulfoxide reductase catalytic subunit MsrP [Pontibacterium sp.]